MNNRWGKVWQEWGEVGGGSLLALGILFPITEQVVVSVVVTGS